MLIDSIVFVTDGKFLSTFTNSAFYIPCFCFRLYHLVIFQLPARGGSVVFSAFITPCRRLLAEAALTLILPVCGPSGSPSYPDWASPRDWPWLLGLSQNGHSRDLENALTEARPACCTRKPEPIMVKQTQLPCLGRTTHRACVPQPMPAKHQTSDQGRAGAASLPASRHGHVRAQQRPAMQTPVRGMTHRLTEPNTRAVCRH